MPDPPRRTAGVASAPLGCTVGQDFGSLEPIPESEQRFRALALAALDRQQTERSKLARLLHDEVAQMLSAAGLQLDILRMDLADRVPEIGARTAEIQHLLDRVVKGIREASYKLNPDIVERAGLQPALDLVVGRFRKSFSGSLRLIYDSSARVPAAVGIAMERIAEEAVTNAIRHARCNQIEIIVKATRSGAALEVRDNGTGFDYPSAVRRADGLGLLLMEYWATKAGLRLFVAQNHDGGVTVGAAAASPPEKEHRMPGLRDRL
jgi:signal transduction histidine kinase